VLLRFETPCFCTQSDPPRLAYDFIDVLTEESIVGRSYLEPYTAKAMRYLISALHDFGDLLKGRAAMCPWSNALLWRQTNQSKKYFKFNVLYWRARRDSNSRLLDSKSSASI
jgi:hypothetical protein